MPKVSICIPCYKQTKYLAKCLDSVFMQDYTDYEIILTDDTSDTTVKDFIEKKYSYKNIIYYKNAASLGTPENWNEAVSKAKGAYIKLLHHDDFFTQKNSLSKLVSLLDLNPASDFGFCATEVWNVPSGKKWIHQCSAKQFQRMKINPEFLFFRNMIGAPSATIYKSALNLSYNKNLKWLVDIDFYIRVIKQNTAIVMTTEALICTADSAEGQVTQNVINDRDLQIKEHLEVFSKIASPNTNQKSFILFFDELFTKSGVKTILQLRTICAIPEGFSGFFEIVFSQLRKNRIYKKVRSKFYGSRINNYFFKKEKY